jgi:uncharacterized protein (DUF2461 family)
VSQRSSQGQRREARAATGRNDGACQRSCPPASASPYRAPQLARYRAAVAADRAGGELEAIIAVIEQAGHEVHGHGTLKSAPRGYPPDHPRIGLLRHKGLTAWQHWEPTPWLQSASVAERLQSFFRTGGALSSWLTLNASG